VDNLTRRLEPAASSTLLTALLAAVYFLTIL